MNGPAGAKPIMKRSRLASDKAVSRDRTSLIRLQDLKQRSGKSRNGAPACIDID
jgi:hypothetical protein